MTKSLLDTFKASDDANVGQTILRLAKLAEARHQFEHAQQLAEDIQRSNGLGPRPVHAPADSASADNAASTACKEVSR